MRILWIFCFILFSIIILELFTLQSKIPLLRVNNVNPQKTNHSIIKGALIGLKPQIINTTNGFIIGHVILVTNKNLTTIKNTELIYFPSLIFPNDPFTYIAVEMFDKTDCAKPMPRSIRNEKITVEMMADKLLNKKVRIDFARSRLDNNVLVNQQNQKVGLNIGVCD